MKYLEQVQREVALQNGYRCTVRKQTQLEAVEIGSPPGFFLRNERLRKRQQPEPDETPEEREQWIEFIARQNRIILTRCVVGEITNGEESFKVVNKSPEEAGSGEISWAMISDADVNAIIEASNQLSGFTRTDEEAVKTFPETQRQGDGGGRTG